LTGAGGASGFYGSYFSNVDQTAAAINTAYAMTVNNVIGENGISVVSGSQITFTSSGTYDIQFSAQLHNNGGGGGGNTVQIWFRKNGTDIPDSATRVAVPTNTPYVVAAWDFMDNFAAGDNFQIMWSTNNTNIGIDHNTATAPAPNIPSVIISVMQVMYNQLGPQGATGATGAATTPTDIQIFSTPGAYTWTKPAGAKSVHVAVISGGGGGGSGQMSASATPASGGGGGGAGARSFVTLSAALLGAFENGNVGSGGAGGASVTSVGLGINGTPGTISNFGLWAYADRGGNGTGGALGAGGSAGSGGGRAIFTGGTGANGSATGAGSNAGQNTGAGGGGGGGGGTPGSVTAGAGGTGGLATSYNGSATAPAAGANGPDVPTGTPLNASGGGGGTASFTAPAMAGGNGGLYGAGGGGGGGGSGFASGKGGNGSQGIVVVTTYF
jgi:hypothetical protein